MRVVTVIGARPQFIKAAAVCRAFAEAPGVEEILVHTGQHYDANMSAVFFDELGIPNPAHHLGIGGGTHGAQTGRMLEAIERVLLADRPDWLLVYGDTNSTVAGALAAGKLHVPVAHVEAGLRSFNRRMPEELNRVVTDHLSDLLFAPTDAAVSNLRDEGCPESAIRRVGDVMFDAALHFGELAAERSEILASLRLRERGFVLATIHRAENTDDESRLAWIVDAIALVGLARPVVLPSHPRTRGALERCGLLASFAQAPGVRLVDPLGYLDMVRLEQAAAAILTDSGGVQKEAFFHGVPCITLRDETEWVELVAAGWNTIVPPGSGSGPETLGVAVERALASPPAARPNLYGTGDTARRIVADLLASGVEVGRGSRA